MKILCITSTRILYLKSRNIVKSQTDNWDNFTASVFKNCSARFDNEKERGVFTVAFFGKCSALFFGKSGTVASEKDTVTLKQRSFSKMWCRNQGHSFVWHQLSYHYSGPNLGKIEKRWNQVMSHIKISHQPHCCLAFQLHPHLNNLNITYYQYAFNGE